MRLDVAFAPSDLAPGDAACRTVVVVDILRFTTTACALFKVLLALTD